MRGGDRPVGTPVAGCVCVCVCACDCVCARARGGFPPAPRLCFDGMCGGRVRGKVSGSGVWVGGRLGHWDGE